MEVIISALSSPYTLKVLDRSIACSMIPSSKDISLITFSTLNCGSSVTLTTAFSQAKKAVMAMNMINSFFMVYLIYYFKFIFVVHYKSPPGRGKGWVLLLYGLNSAHYQILAHPWPLRWRGLKTT